MDQASFDRFVRILRCVYLGRSQTARTIPADELSDWYRLADIFRALIGDTGCLEWSDAHESTFDPRNVMLGSSSADPGR